MMLGSRGLSLDAATSILVPLIMKGCSLLTREMIWIMKNDGDYTHCKCDKCQHDSRNDCLGYGCRCCDLEDAFSLAVRADWDSR